MTFFKKLFAKAATEPKTVAEQPATQEQALPGIVSLAVLLDELPTSLDTMAREFPERLPALGPMQIDRESPQDPVFPAIMDVGGHSVWALGFDLPMPEEAQKTAIFYSNWGTEQLAPLYAHRAHVLLYYKSGSLDPVVQLSVLYAVAAGLHPLGVADEAAHNCVPGEVLPAVTTAEFLEGAQSNIPSLIWTGFQKFHRADGQTWYATRGFERFGKPNLAFLAPAGQGERATDLFHTLLNYQHFYQQTFEAGHTADLGGQFLRFAEPHEYAAYLSGGLPILTVSIDP